MKPERVTTLLRQFRKQRAVFLAKPPAKSKAGATNRANCIKRLDRDIKALEEHGDLWGNLLIAGKL